MKKASVLIEARKRLGLTQQQVADKAEIHVCQMLSVNFELIPIKDLAPNQNYERNLSKQQIKRMAESFNMSQINPIKVVRRDGVNHIISGQQTVEAIALVTGSRDTFIWCVVYN